MKIWLLGKNGQVGWELQRALAPLGEVFAMDYEDCDFGAPGDLRKMIHSLKPDCIVNAAAYTAVDRAEQEVDLAHAINAVAPAVLAEESARIGAWFVHYSTDYVFDGSGREPRLESEKTGPLNVYGQTKLAGEQAIQASGCKYLIFRTSWVYAARGQNFVKSILRLAQEKNRLSIVDDQVGAPTGAELLADVTAHAIRAMSDRSEVAGLYHLTATGETSWCGFARFVLEIAQSLGLPLKVSPESIEAIPTSEYPTPAKRPLNSRLDTSKVCTTFDLHLPDWRSGVSRTLHELCENRR